MNTWTDKLRHDATAIWRAGVDAVVGDRVVQDCVRHDGQCLTLGSLEFDLDAIDRIHVVGAGKAGAMMSLGLEAALGDAILERCQVTGWVNVPDDCQRALQNIHLHPSRPQSRNEPTLAGMEGARRIMRIVQSLGPRDLCIGLFSGGGSALLPLPVDGVTLEEKIRITRHLSAAGANIWQLNAVRKRLSQIKGGGLARACRAGALVSLIISDVLGDPLDVIASGPTVMDAGPGDTGWAPDVVASQFGLREMVSETTWDLLTRQPEPGRSDVLCRVHNLVVANNAKAVAAAARQAKMLGYRCEILPTESSDCPAEDVGRDLARRCWRQAISNGGGLCYMSGGEPIVRLSPADRRGKGGRNQQVALAALDELIRLGAHDAEQLRGLILLSGGTDGEDGPTDAAGALIDATTLQRLLAGSRSILDVPRSLERNDAYPLFSDLDSLLKTGPTGTNVCDLRVAIVSAERKPPSSPRGSLTFDLALPPRNHPGSPQPTTTLPG